MHLGRSQTPDAARKWGPSIGGTNRVDTTGRPQTSKELVVVGLRGSERLPSPYVIRW